MLDLVLGKRHRNCSGISRRDMLRVGTLGPLGLSLTGLLNLQQARAEESTPRGHAKNVILIYLGGGLSHHDSFDLKPEAPEEVRGKYKPIETNVPGTQVGELLPLMAKQMDKVALVRSGAHNNDHHETATNWVLSGRFGSAFGDWPAIGAVVAHESGFTSELPPYVAVPKNPSFTWELGRSAYLGGRCESFKAGDPNAENFQVRDLSLPNKTGEINSMLARRGTLLDAIDGLSRKIDGNDQLKTYDEFQQRAAEMILSSQAQAAFQIGSEEPKLRDRYGRHTFGQSCLLARRLVERGVRFVTVNFGGWDHHAKIWDGLEKKMPELDQGLSALLSDMHERGQFEDTLLAVFGEFGRTPNVNQNAGRDHWGPAASLLFAGPGVQHGKVIGSTDKLGAHVTDSAVRPADVAFTIFQALGINPRKQLRTPDGRPVEILDEGESIDALFA